MLGKNAFDLDSLSLKRAMGHRFVVDVTVELQLMFLLAIPYSRCPSRLLLLSAPVAVLNFVIRLLNENNDKSRVGLEVNWARLRVHRTGTCRSQRRRIIVPKNRGIGGKKGLEMSSARTFW